MLEVLGLGFGFEFGLVDEPKEKGLIDLYV